MYAYSFQVADDEEQTYIAKEEARDGSDVTGKYSYVDATGALVTVTYRADAAGYSEEREVQPNFLVVRARPAAVVAPVVAPAPAPVVRRVVNTAPAVQRVVTTETSSASSDSDLVSRILSQLTPFIRQTVSSSLSNQQTTATTRRVQQPAVARR